MRSSTSAIGSMVGFATSLVGAAARAAQLEAQLERGERLSQLVVQLAREEPPLLLFRRLQLLVKLPQPVVGDAQVLLVFGPFRRSDL